MPCGGSGDVPLTFVVDCFGPSSSSPRSGLLRRSTHDVFTMGGGTGIGYENIVSSPHKMMTPETDTRLLMVSRSSLVLPSRYEKWWICLSPTALLDSLSSHNDMVKRMR